MKIAHTHCDECGREMANAHRVENGIAYCVTCYARVFKVVACVRCNGSLRAHKNETSPVCRKCILSERVCVRCRRLTPRAGLRVGAGVLCPSCAPHGRAPSVCASCGKSSSRTSPAPAFGPDSRICQSCRQTGYATCSTCRKHRKVSRHDDKGRAVCVQCDGETPERRICPGCGAVTPGRGSSPCHACTLANRIEKRIRLNLELIEQAWCRSLFESFCRWEKLPKEAGNMTRRIDRYARFFREVDMTFNEPTQITQNTLFGLFGAHGLSRSFWPTAFLIEWFGLIWNHAEIGRSTEEKRVEAYRKSWNEKPWKKDMEDYLDYLLNSKKRSGRKLQFQTIRIYLNAAQRLLVHADVCTAKDLNSEHITKFLRKSYGQAASLTSFRTFLHTTYSVEVAVAKPRRSTLRQIEKKLIGDVDSVVARINTSISQRESRALLARLISALYQVPLSSVLALRWSDVQKSEFGWVISIKDQAIQVDSRIDVYIDRLALAGKGGYVFSGRNSYQPLSYNAVWYYRRYV